MNKILITGGAGFIGSHTVDLSLKAGKQVIVFDNLSTGKLGNLDLSHPNLEFIQGDILDYAALLKQIERVDGVLHLAALPSVPLSIEDPIHSLKINTQGLVHVLQAIRQKNQHTRLVYASSAAIYGATSVLPCNDESELDESPLSPYALEKANNERYADLFYQLFGIKSLGLRYFNVYGPRQDPQSPYSGVIAKFIESYQKAETITICGDGRQSRDFIHVTDIAKANLLALEKDYHGKLNIATGVAETLNDLVSYIAEVGKKPAKVTYVTERKGDIRHSFAFTQHAERQLSFRYTIRLADGIRSLIEGA